MTAATLVTSAANPLVKTLRKLAQGNSAYRQQGQVWLEGDHLCRAALARGLQPALWVFAEGGLEAFSLSAGASWRFSATKSIVMPAALFASISALESPARVGCLLDLPTAAPLAPQAATVVLDRVQDAGNVGSILRSAAAFGFSQVVALQGTAALWSPKVLRAGMGAHFGLQLIEGADLQSLEALQVPLVVTSSHQGNFLHQQALPNPCAWVLGHEGQGVCEALIQRATVQVRVAQPGGEESLNVASAAAICLHASAVGHVIL